MKLSKKDSLDDSKVIITTDDKTGIVLIDWRDCFSGKVIQRIKPNSKGFHKLNRIQKALNIAREQLVLSINNQKGLDTLNINVKTNKL